MHDPQVREVKLSEIKFDESQPRKRKNDQAVRELADSIKEVGLINAIELDEDNVLVTGETRYRAFKLLGRETIPAKTVKRDELTFARQLIENVQRSAMDELDVARAVIKLQHDTGLKTGEIAKKLGIPSGRITEYLHALDVAPEVLAAHEANKIDFEQLSALRVADHDLERELLPHCENGTFKGRHLRCLISFINRTGDKEVIAAAAARKLTADQLINWLRERNPSQASMLATGVKKGAYLVKAATNLAAALATTPIDELDESQFGGVAFALNSVMTEFEKIEPQLKKMKEKFSV